MTELLQRLQKELKLFNQDNPADSLIQSLGPDPNDPACDPLTWFSQIVGPPNSPFHQGVFTLKITIPANYPSAPP